MTGSVLPPAELETAAAGSAEFPWPPPAGASIPGGFFRTWTGSVFDPAGFFAAMPVPGPTGPALLYYFSVGIFLAAVDLFWQLTFTLAIGAAAYFTRISDAFGLSLNALSPIVWTLFAPALLALMLLLVFAAVQPTLWLLGGARRGPATTLRVLCYAYGARGFAVIPLIGGLIGSVWMIVVAIIGLREAHGTDGWRAALAVLLPIIAVFGLFVMVGVLAALFVGLSR